jgi:hypothetical protein
MGLAIKNKVVLGAEILQGDRLRDGSPIGGYKIVEHHVVNELEAMQWTLE